MGNGKKTKGMEKENSFQRMEIYMMECGQIIKEVDLELKSIKMEISMREIGRMIRNKDWPP